MEKGFRFECRWSDAALYSLQLTAWNGEFGASARIYLPIGGFEETAKRLMGFPKDLCDQREITLGNLNPEYGGGGIRFQFSCVDGAGHVVARSRIEADPVGSQYACYVSSVEPAAIDRFVEELR